MDTQPQWCSVVIDVQGMHCESCIQLIETTLSDEPGVISIKVRLTATAAMSKLVKFAKCAP